MASNQTTLQDEDGDYSDWIEIHNPGSTSLSLENWTLTDDPSSLQKWAFPNVTIPANGHLIVFASGKNRSTPGSQLHTNFELNQSGEYLALISPGSNNASHAFTPKYPEQFEDISYGVLPGQTTNPTDLISATQARYLVPSAPVLEAWKGGATFDDSTWSQATGKDLAFTSVELSPLTGSSNQAGTQSYTGKLGIDFQTTDTITVPSLRAFDDNSDGFNRTITVELWSRNTNGTPLDTSDDTGNAILASQTFTSGSPGTLETSYRYKTLATPLTLPPGHYTIVAYGYGSGERIFNGGTSGYGSTNTGGTPVSFVGSSRFGTSGNFPGNIDQHPHQFGAGMFKFSQNGPLSQEMQGINASVFIREKFTVTNPASISNLNLTINYDDGFVAYLNGVQVASINAPANPTFNSSALTETNSSATLDLSGYIHLLTTGENILAFHAMNATVNDSDFSIRPNLTTSTTQSIRRYFPTPTAGQTNNNGVGYPGIVIHEIHYNDEDKNQPTEFIELYNAGHNEVDLSAWQFTDGVQFTFPAGTTLSPQRYLVIAASPTDVLSKFGVTALGPWTGKLSNLGEKIILRNASGNVVDEVDYQVGFPWPTVGDAPYNSIELVGAEFDNDLGSSWRSSQAPTPYAETTYIARSSNAWRYRPGTSEASTPTDRWLNSNFTEDTSWSSVTTPIGYGNVGSPTVALNTTITGMQGSHTSAYFRHIFSINDGIIPNTLKLAHLIEDGAVVYLNGHEVFRVRVPGSTMPAYNATATNAQPEPNGYTEITLNNVGSYLHNGTNVLAVHLINTQISSSDIIMDLELTRPGLASGSAEPTPGRPNSSANNNLPPQARQLNITPESPTSQDDVVISMKMTDFDGVASAILSYQIVQPGSYIRISDPNYETQWTNITMHDDGMNGDAIAADHVYSVRMPASLHAHRHLMRFRITVTDSLGHSQRLPYTDDPQPNFAYFVYDGVPAWTGAVQPGTTTATTFSTNVTRSVPSFHLISREQDVTDCQYNGAFNDGIYRFPGTLISGNKVYDHIHYRVRGQNSTYNTGKNKWKMRFNRGHYFQHLNNYGVSYKTKIKTLNIAPLSAPWAAWNRGLAGLDEGLVYKVSNLIGTPAPNARYFQFRIIDDVEEAPAADQYGGDAWGLYLAFEQHDARFKDQHNLPDGNIFRMQQSATRLLDQGTGEPGDLSDVNTFTSTYNSGLQPETWWRSNVDLPTYFNWRTIMEAVNNTDIRDRENSVYFHNPDTGLWSILPWDVDLLYEKFDRWGPDGVQTTAAYEQIRRCLQHPSIHREFQNHARSLQDLLFNPDQSGKVIDEMLSHITTNGASNPGFVEVDHRIWDWHPRSRAVNGAPHQGNYYRSPFAFTVSGDSFTRTLNTPDFAGQVQWVRDFIIQGGFGGDQLASLATNPNIPATPVITDTSASGHPIDSLTFTSSNYSSPVSSNFTAQQWRIAEIYNPSVTNYQIGEPYLYEINAIWDSGETAPNLAVTIPPGNLASNRNYRVRTRYKDALGNWSHWSAPIEFTSSSPGTLPYNQSIVISQVMYHPANPSTQEELAASLDDTDFEFIELLNISNTTLNLTPLSFTDGITFDFSTSTISSLAPSQRVLLVKNIQAFEARYGTGHPIAGEYSGKLSNSGETITLSFGLSETVKSFTYTDTSPWPESPDGSGPSMVLIAPFTNPDHTIASNWRASFTSIATPGQADDNAFTGNPHADDDNDGLSALMETAVGTATGTPNALPLSFSLNPDGSLLVSYTRNLALSNVALDLQTSQNLEVWANVSESLTPDSRQVNGQLETLIWTISPAEPGETKKFIRLIARLP